MVDALRGNIKRIVEECPNIVLEGDDLRLLLDGRIDDLINRDKKEDSTIESVISEIDDSDENAKIEVDVKSDEDIDLNEESEKGESTKYFGLF